MKIGFLLMQFQIEARDVAPKEQGISLQKLLGMDDRVGVEDGTPFEEPMLVLHELSSQQLQGVLNGMKTLHASVPLKAITTEQNLSWSASHLFRELCAERSALQNR